MAHKKESNHSGLTLSEDETIQVQQLLETYSQIAQQLRESTNQAQAETALNSITALPEGAQLALLKALVREHETDAADILAALNAFHPGKEVRKEARRSLIRLEAAKIVPQWTPPIMQASAIQVNIVNAPRFWKGLVTQSREEGELQLVLCWEQGYDYSEVRTLTFLLDFWREGVKEFLVEVTGKRTIDNRIDEMRMQLPDMPLIDCTLVEGKRLLEEALSVNEWRDTAPYAEYRRYLPTINQLILQVSDLGEDRGRTFINPDLTEEEVLINYLGGWALGDYGLAYDLLTHNSSIRVGLARAEWIELHRAWADEAQPTRMELGFVHEREHRQSALWLPPSTQANRLPSRKEIEIGWSLELLDTPLSGTLKEMPMGTAINKETGRHWFWTNYTLMREQDGWRIQSQTDEGASIQGLPIAELQQRIKEYEEAIEARVKQRDTDATTFVQELSWRFTQLLHCYDALIVRLPLDYQMHEDAYSRSVAIGNPERVIVYLERMLQRFPNNRGELQKRLGSTLVGLAYNYAEQGLSERSQAFLTRAETVLREAIGTEDDVTGHTLLGELLLSLRRNDEAEAELQKASTMASTPTEEASIEAGLGNVAMRRERMDDAIPHYQRVAELNPNYPGIWFNIGFAQRLLGQLDEAEATYKHAVQIEPTDIRSYSDLTAIYMNRGENQHAHDIMEQGIRANPDSAHLHALFASVLFELGDARGAQRELQQAEAIDPSLEIVQSVRQYVNSTKKR